LLLDLTTGFIEKLAKEFREADPEIKEHFVQSSVAMLEILTETLKTSIRFEEK